MVIEEILAVIHELYSLGVLGIGRRRFIDRADEEWAQKSLPIELEDSAEWAWPDENESKQRWYLYQGTHEVEGRGLLAVSDARARELMFGASGPNNSPQDRRL